MKKILFPTDFSEASKKAFQYTLKLARDYNSEVTLFHTYRQFASPTTPVILIEPADHTGQYAENYMKDFIEAAEEMNGLSTKEIKVEYELVMGLAADEIIAKSKSGHYNLIAMGKTGQTNLMDTILGSVTLYTVSKSRCPVLAIPDHAEYKGINRIMFATNLLGIKSHLLKEVMEMAEQLQASIYFVHVLEDGQSEEQIRTMLLDEIFKSKSEPKVPFEIHSLSGKTVDEALNTFIEKKQIDLMVMITKHRGIWDRIFGKSNTRKMVLHTEIPLLVLHSEDELDL